MSITNKAGSYCGFEYNHAKWKARAESAIADVSRLLRERDEEIARAERAEEELRSRHQEHFRMRERAQRAERIVEAVKALICYNALMARKAKNRNYNWLVSAIRKATTQDDT